MGQCVSLKSTIQSFLTSADNDHIVKQLFDKYDTNKNGVLEGKEILCLLDDFLDLIAQDTQVTEEQRRSAKILFLNVLDKNHDREFLFTLRDLAMQQHMQVDVTNSKFDIVYQELLNWAPQSEETLPEDVPTTSNS